MQGSVGLEKPDCIDDLDWSRLQRMEQFVKNLQELETQYNDVETKSYDVNIKEHRISQLKTTVEGQLRFINELLQDPSVIDRIESYDTTFAKGNFDNLKKVSQLLEREKQQKMDKDVRESQIETLNQ